MDIIVSAMILPNEPGDGGLSNDATVAVLQDTLLDQSTSAWHPNNIFCALEIGLHLASVEAQPAGLLSVSGRSFDCSCSNGPHVSTRRFEVVTRMLDISRPISIQACGTYGHVTLAGAW